MTNIQLLKIYLRPYPRQLLLLTVLLLAGIGLQLVAPQIIRRFLDAAQGGAAVPLLVSMGLVFLVAVVAQKAITLASTYVGADLGWAATNSLRADLTEHCMRLDMGFHKLKTPGELIERIDGDVSHLAEYFSELVVQVFASALLLGGILIILFREDWRFGLIGLVYAVCTIGLLRLIHTPTTRVWGEISRGYADLHGYVEERIGGTEDIRANGGEQYVLNGLYPRMALVADKRVKAHLWGGVTFHSSYMLYVVVWVFTLGLSGAMYTRGQISIGTMVMLVSYIALMETPIKYIRRQAGNLQKAVASIGRINEFLQLAPEVKERVTAVLPTRALSVQFAGVSFAYKDQLAVSDGRSVREQLAVSSEESPISNLQSQTVLKDITFHLEPGKILGLLGRTGSGKTTLTRLLFRLYDVDEGAITLDGIDVHDVALSDLRGHIGMVTQEVQLFEATVRDNLTLFRNYDPDAPPISDAQIIEAIQTLGLESWFRDLPDGLDTMLKSGGQGLSAGEAQLLAFTRVFLRNPHLIILDEASSRLDPATEQLLERAIDRLLHGRTAIIIAHRLGTVQRADDILILEHGRVAEQGKRILLANTPSSRFYSLLQTGLEEVLV
ncbi:MAG: ABC transporter ATP-binding protein/permease [Anaerolineae bacterium]|nr:ABC transporter ATP-binding protein/permease [Anaerolineae bacterium]